MTEGLTPIPEYPGYYVNEQGEVFSTISNGAKGELRRLHQSPSSLGYLYVSPACGPKGKRKIRRTGVHVLMLQTFVGPRPEGHEARHLDGVRTNNTLANLAWGTKKENAADRIRHGRQIHGEHHPSARLTESDVVEIRRRAARGETMYSLAREFGVIGPSVKALVYGKSWAHVPVDPETAALIEQLSIGNGIGEKNFHARLTKDDVRTIRKRHANGGVSFAQLGREYGIAKGSVKAVVDRKTWKHV